MAAGKLVLIMGPSGVGKSVILKKLRSRHPEMHFPRSATTRPRRPGEGDELYHFLDDAQFDELLREGKLLESAVVHGGSPWLDGSVRAGARYGTLHDEIIPFIEQGRTVVREVDVQGFDSIRRHMLFSGHPPRYRLQSIFILPESKEQLLAHITRRSPMTDGELKRRTVSMEREMQYADLSDIRIRNVEDKLEETLKEVEKAITLSRH